MNGARAGRPFRVAAIIEAGTVTGPAKNLIEFCRLARIPGPDGAAANLSLITFHRGRGDALGSNQFIDAVNAAEIPLHVIPERFRFDWSVVSQLRSILSAAQPDVVQTHGVKSHFLIWASGLFRSYAWIAFHHGYTAEDLKMRLYNRLNGWSLPRARRVVTVCKPFADALARSGVNRERLHILPNSVRQKPVPDAALLLSLRQQLGIAPAEQVLLCIGRFSQEKAQIDLLQAAAHLTRDPAMPPFKLVLVGDGPERQALERAAGALGLASRVVFTGHQRDTAPYYALADLFVLPSHSEGSPNVILEAMAAGVPIVATAVGGVPETVQHEHSALLAPASRPEELARAIGRLLAQPSFAAALAANATAALPAFSPLAYRNSVLHIYGRALGEG